MQARFAQDGRALGEEGAGRPERFFDVAAGVVAEVEHEPVGSAGDQAGCGGADLAAGALGELAEAGSGGVADPARAPERERELGTAKRNGPARALVADRDRDP